MDNPMQLQSNMSQEPGDDLAYCIELYVFKNGTYRVSRESSGQEKAEHEATETQEGAGGQDYPNLGEALKGILDIVKSNPAGEDANAQMEAGFGGKEPPQSRMSM